MQGLISFDMPFINVWLAEFCVVLFLGQFVWQMFRRKNCVISFTKSKVTGGHPAIWFATVALLAHEAAGWRFHIISLPAFVAWLGVVVTLVGVLLNKWSFRTMQKYMTPPGSVPRSDQAMLVATGPYRLIRHPAYLSYFLVFVGLQLVATSPFIVCAVPMYQTFRRWMIAEEVIMCQLFTEAYRRYQRTTFRGL